MSKAALMMNYTACIKSLDNCLCFWNMPMFLKFLVYIQHSAVLMTSPLLLWVHLVLYKKWKHKCSVDLLKSAATTTRRGWVSEKPNILLLSRNKSSKEQASFHNKWPKVKYDQICVYTLSILTVSIPWNEWNVAMATYVPWFCTSYSLILLHTFSYSFILPHTRSYSFIPGSGTRLSSNHE